MSEAPLTPPTSPPQRLRRPGPILRFFAWITEPSLIKGVALGVVMSLVVMVANKLDALWYAASGLLLIAIALLFGAIIGHYVLEGRKRRLQRDALGLLAEAGAALPEIGEELFVFLQQRDRHNLHVLITRLGRIRPAARELVMLLLAMVFRVMAMGSLLAVLGGAISFAVFLATYLQVERMGEQNELLKAQNELVRAEMRALSEQSNIDVALSVAAQRQTIVLELMNAVDAELAQRAELGDDGDRARRLSPGMYRRIGRTLAQLQPYYPVEALTDEEAAALAALTAALPAPADPQAQPPGPAAPAAPQPPAVLVRHRLSAVSRSPEQEMLVRFLEGSHVDLSQVILRRARLNHSDLRELELAKIDLSGARFDHADLSGTDLSGAYLEGADFREAVLERTLLLAAKLAKADLRRARLIGADLSDAALSGADLTLADLRTATLDKAVLDGASLAGVDLKDADLFRVKLSDTDLTGADLSAINKPPSVEALKLARNWWLAAYTDDLAAKLGLPAERNAANRDACARLRALGEAEAAAVLESMRAAAPTPPA
jgi:uncharacterized protein YjbI with pentapeptide repeats